MLKVVVLSEAGATYGYGHKSRCDALSDALKIYGAQVSFYIKDETDWFLNYKDLIRGVDIVIIDSYHATLEIYQDIAMQVMLCVCFDDDNRLPYPPSYIIKDRAILRKPFWQASKKPSLDIGRIFISLGGTNNEAYLYALILAIRHKFPNIALTIASKIDKTKLNCYDKILYDASEEQIASAMLECDAAISAGGQTMLELCALGIPTVAVILVPNQISNVKRAKQNNHIVDFVDIADANWASKAVNLLQIKQWARLEPETKSVALEIIKNFFWLALLQNMRVDDFEFISFANISKKEALQILQWRNDFRVREYSFNNALVSQKAHLAFIKNRCKDNKSFYFMFSKNGLNIGVVNLSKIDWQNLTAYVGIYIAPEFMNQGYGVTTLRAFEGLLFARFGFRKLIAEISSNNKASIATFKKCGYKQEGCLSSYFLDGSDLLLYGINNAK